MKTALFNNSYNKWFIIQDTFIIYVFNITGFVPPY